MLFHQAQAIEQIDDAKEPGGAPAGERFPRQRVEARPRQKWTAAGIGPDFDADRRTVRSARREHLDREVGRAADVGRGEQVEPLARDEDQVGLDDRDVAEEDVGRGDEDASEAPIAT